MRKIAILVVLILICAAQSVHTGSQPIRSKTGMVISASDVASQVGAQILRSGGYERKVWQKSSSTMSATAYSKEASIGGNPMAGLRRNEA